MTAAAHGRSAVLGTMATTTRARTRCHFCSSRAADEAAVVVVHLARRTGGERHTTTAVVPRCETCRRGHETVPDTLRRVHARLPVAVLGLTVALATAWVVLEEGRHGSRLAWASILGLLLAVLLPVAMMPLCWLVETGYRRSTGTRPIDFEKESEAVSALISEGWRVQSAQPHHRPGLLTHLLDRLP
jgi:hypothetical protein